MASVVLVGRLTRDAELKYTNSGEAIGHFCVATDSRVKKGDQWVEEPSFWEVDLWGKRAESVNQYLTKGKLVAVSGPVRIEKWEHEGKQFQKARVTANDVQLLGGGQGQGQADKGGSQGAGAPASKPAGAGSGLLKDNANDDFTDDIPF
jgi:single-strand DNA-binding protein